MHLPNVDDMTVNDRLNHIVDEKVSVDFNIPRDHVPVVCFPPDTCIMVRRTYFPPDTAHNDVLVQRFAPDRVRNRNKHRRLAMCLCA